MGHGCRGSGTKESPGENGALGYKKAFHFITKVQFKIQINLFLG